MNAKSAKRIGITCIITLPALISSCYAIIARHPHTGAVTGRVVDQNGPVPHARVIVSFSDWHLDPILDAGQHDVGIQADENGKFSVEHEFDFRIGHISVSAVSPVNELGWTNVEEPRDCNEAVIVRLGRKVDHPELYRYDTFQMHSNPETIFVGRAWLPPHWSRGR